MKYLIILLSAGILASCSFMPKPLNNPAISTLGKKCTTSGHWSYVWIHDRNNPLHASAEECIGTNNDY